MIISCSRRTDIPAFYSDWFFNRLHEGYVLVRYPLNPHQVGQVSLKPVDVNCIVFWTKDPTPMLDRLHLLKDYHYYFQFTLTPYDTDIEPYLPPKDQILNSFIRLSEQIGKKRIIWRYDPIILSERMNSAYHIEHFGNLARRLSDHTEKCIISFIDMYRHIQSRMASLSLRPPDASEMRMLAENMAEIGGRQKMKIETCAEEIDLADLGIEHGRCIDDRLISELTGTRLKFEKDKSQRKLCGCAAGIDIGDYNTCRHLCSYCYANTSQKTLEKNFDRHDNSGLLLVGETSPPQKIIRHYDN